MKKLYVVLGSGLMLTALSTSAVLLLSGRGSQPPSLQGSSGVLASTVFKNDTYGLSLSYPVETEVINLSEQDKKDKFVLKLQHVTRPEYLINVKAETGLRLPAQLAKLDVVDLVVDGAIKALPSRYPGYKLINQEEFMVEGKAGAVIEFTYLGPAKELIHQRLLLIEKDIDTALYFTMQSRDSDFLDLEASIFDQLQASIELDK